MKRLAKATFQKREETAAQDVATQLFEEQAALHERVAKAAGETIDLVNQMSSDGDPTKQEVAKLLKASLLHGITSMQEVATGRLTADGGKEALQGNPFADSSRPSGTSLPGTSTAAAAESRGLPGPEASEVEKPRRGRPPKPKS